MGRIIRGINPGGSLAPGSTAYARYMVGLLYSYKETDLNAVLGFFFIRRGTTAIYLEAIVNFWHTLYTLTDQTFTLPSENIVQQ